jgi:F0F1-type ATP synthase assembly protein I
MPAQREPSPWRYAGVGLELAGVVAVLAWLGYAFDNWRGTAPWGVLAGSTIGVVGGLYNLVKQVIREQGGESKQDQEKR